MQFINDMIIFDNGYSIPAKFISRNNFFTTLKAVYRYCKDNPGNRTGVTVKEMIEHYNPATYDMFSRNEKLLAGAIVSKMYVDGKFSKLKRCSKKQGNTWVYYVEQ
ncbi:MAG: hypothetical protein ACI4JM_07360 [Oscillospiraceae bacterium]